MAVSAVFIFGNSLSGLAWVYHTHLPLSFEMVFMLVMAMIGGNTWSYIGDRKLNKLSLNNMLASVLLIADLKLFLP